MLAIAVAVSTHACGLLAAQSDPKPQTDVREQIAAWLKLPSADREQAFPTTPIPKQHADAVVAMVFDQLRAEARAARADELRAADAGKRQPTKLLTVAAAGKRMKVYERTFGDAPATGHSLWISMHGGGGAPARVNDGQWENQIKLYRPEEGIYVAPRAPTNTWNLWHEAHIDALFDRLIENYVIDRGVDPNRVYLLGYSAGGDGVYQLAPRMADRFAAAAMMAGHPNGVPVLGLRNLPFQIWMGAEDGAYKRNEQARAYGEKLQQLAGEDPGGYLHETHIVAGKGHWMGGQDAAALPWMAQHTRSPWPAKVVWQQTGRTHDRCYWLAMPAGAAKAGQVVRAAVDGQVIRLQTTGVERLRLRLNDALLDLDRAIRVVLDGEELPAVEVTRSARAIYESLQQRLDPASVATAVIDLGS